VWSSLDIFNRRGPLQKDQCGKKDPELSLKAEVEAEISDGQMSEHLPKGLVHADSRGLIIMS
jgi:hypothetical protein